VGEGRVIAGQHGDLFTCLLEALERGQGDGWHEKNPHYRRYENYCE
jgi:hypothetical protein